jgi:hypothetical protein
VDAVLNSLLGVVAGGAVTYASQRGLDGRREGREREREERAEERAAADTELTTKAVARLVFVDLLSIFTYLRSSREVNRWWIAVLLPDSAWKQHREQLCRALNDQAFRVLGSTFGGVEAWNALCGASRRYYWVRPHLPLKRAGNGLTDMRDTLVESSARALLELVALGFGTIEPDDSLITMIKHETTDNAPSAER